MESSMGPWIIWIPRVLPTSVPRFVKGGGSLNMPVLLWLFAGVIATKLLHVWPVIFVKGASCLSRHAMTLDGWVFLLFFQPEGFNIFQHLSTFLLVEIENQFLLGKVLGISSTAKKLNVHFHPPPKKKEVPKAPGHWESHKSPGLHGEYEAFTEFVSLWHLGLCHTTWLRIKWLQWP